ncbi:DUF3553 domain-containing protein [Rubellimicrobium sp. CFH 75288]|uniref:DUF3553 domain-containing protein n=1 Tax=Rubellimicrobium sp. CFH 75288 TaxID=2697034 RepID=UPI001411D843|nr:DUF3553 domain-containing protein [Rubellimicrobium sp. CFH 75288]NAZ36805.1 DUF3553 domain-containing protein [Rubellimicrobium sp. CFH 75288]
MSDILAILAPGMIVAHRDRPDWGRGQVQSVIGTHVTVMFPELGKLVLDGTEVPLLLISTGPEPS